MLLIGIFKILGNIRRIIPSSCYQQILLILVGSFGALRMLTQIACVMFMPVSFAGKLDFLAVYDIKWGFLNGDDIP